MQISLEEDDDGLCVIHLAGNLVLSEAAALKTALLDALEKHLDIEVHLSEVSELDSAGFQVLILVKREALQAHKTVRLCRHSPAVIEVLETYRMVSYFGDPLVLSGARDSDESGVTA